MPALTDPTLIAEIDATLTALDPAALRQIDTELDGVSRGLPDDLAEIVQYAYEPHALQDYAHTVGVDEDAA